MSAGADFVAAAEAIVGAANLLRDAETLAPYLVDSRLRYTGRTLGVARPASTEEVAALVRLCAAHGVSITPQGGNTGLSGGATPAREGETLLIRLDRMNRIRHLSPVDNTITVEAGCVLADIQAAAAGVDRLFPLSLGAEGTCQIGGNIATNAGGTAVLRFGPTRDLVLGLEAVLPDGTILSGLHRLRKDNTGYDLKQLLIGSEGTLGIITAAVLKLFPRPRTRAVALLGIASVEDGLDMLDRLRGALGDHLTSIELLSGNYIPLIRAQVEGVTIPLAEPTPFFLLIEVGNSIPSFDIRAALEDVLGAAHEEGRIGETVIASNEAQAAALWQIRHSVSAGVRRGGFPVAHDHSVPIDRQPEFVRQSTERLNAAYPAADVLFAGHIGDGNLHVVALFDRDLLPTPAEREPVIVAINHLLDDVAVGLGGSISAEHGIGVALRHRLERTTPAAELELMRRIKAVIDPAGIMNPGKIV